MLFFNSSYKYPIPIEFIQSAGASDVRIHSADGQIDDILAAGVRLVP